MKHAKKQTYRAGIMGKLATLFISHRELGVLVVLGITFWGILGFVQMPKQYNPEITAPAFNIITKFPGATTSEVYELITRPMEDKMREIPTVDKIMAQSHDGGASIVTVQFYIGENIEDAKITLTQKLASNMDMLPLGAQQPLVKAIDPDDVPIMTLALTSDILSPESLRRAGFDIADAVKQIPDTSVVTVSGGRQKHMMINLDPDKLRHYGISIPTVMQMVQANNMYMSAGNIEQGDTRYRVVVQGDLANVDDVKNIVLTQVAYTPIKISDVADVEYAYDEITDYSLFGTKEHPAQNAVYVAISKLKGSNSTNITDAVLERVEKLRTEFADVNIDVVRNEGDVAREATMALTQNLFMAIVIVALVLLPFLGWKSAVIVLVAIPLTLASVFGIGNMSGQTINRITLFALILSLGILVDAAIVVVENIFRLFKENPTEDKVMLISRAVDEVGVGLMMSTATVTLAFFPMAFVGGMMGPYMGPIPFFVPVALVASLAIALSINPFLLYLVTQYIRDKKSSAQDRKNIFLRIIDRVRAKYVTLLTALLDSSAKRRVLVFTVVVLLFASLALPAFKIVQFRMLPKSDTERFSVYVDLPQYASLEYTNNIVRDIEQQLLAKDYVVSVQSYIGTPQIVDFNGLFKGSDGRVGANQATIKVNITHHTTRDETSEQLVLALRPELAQFVAQHPDVKVKLIEDPPGPPVLSTYLLKIDGADTQMVERITRDMEHLASGIDEVVDIDTTLNEQTVEHVLKVDTEKANRAGIPAQQIAVALRTMLSGMPVTLYHEQTAHDTQRKPEQEYVILHTKKSDRDDVSELSRIYLTNSYGQSIPLSSITKEVAQDVVPILYTDQRHKTHYVTAEMGDRSVVYASIDTLVELVKNYRLPDGNGELVSWSLFGVTYRDTTTGEQYHVLLDGEWKLTLEVFRDMGIAFAVAILAIYFLLVARFRSLMIPSLILVTISFSFIGVLPGFALLGWIKGTYFTATSMIGVIALAGIVVNNAIMLLEYLNRLHDEGLPIKEAIVRAGNTRLLPILMTTLTTILGSLTIIADPVWEGLAWAIVWGLSVSAALTLIVFPVLYYKFERKHW